MEKREEKYKQEDKNKKLDKDTQINPENRSFENWNVPKEDNELDQEDVIPDKGDDFNRRKAS